MKDTTKYMEYMTLLGELFDKRLSKALKDTYWKILEPYSDKDCIRAFDNIIGHCKFFPKPADFLDHLRGDIKDQGLLAWEKVFTAIGSTGPYESVKFDDPVIHSCIEVMGGWVELCNITNNEIKWKQKEFAELYAAMSRKSSHPPYLAGVMELDNKSRGFDCPEVKLIGNSVKQIEGGTDAS